MFVKEYWRAPCEGALPSIEKGIHFVLRHPRRCKPVLHTNADAIPLGSGTKIRISKFLFIDIGVTDGQP